MKKQKTSHLRRADLTDASVLAHLMNMVSEGELALKFGADADIDETWLNVARKLISQTTSELSYTNCIVYEIDGDVAGMMLLNWLSSHMPEIDVSQIDEDARPANELVMLVSGSLLIRELGVFEKYRKQGIAKAFLQLAEGYAKSKSIPMLSLTVHETSTAALAAYQNYGFEFVNFRPILEHSSWAKGSKLFLMCKQMAQKTS